MGKESEFGIVKSEFQNGFNEYSAYKIEQVKKGLYHLHNSETIFIGELLAVTH